MATTKVRVIKSIPGVYVGLHMVILQGLLQDISDMSGNNPCFFAVAK